MEEKIEARLKRAIEEVTGIDAARLTDDFNLVDDGDLDSLDTVEMVMEIECVFDIEISDDDMNVAQTYGALRALVLGKL